MDKSFNDQELSDIMKEIEALEEEFSGTEASSVSTTSVLEKLAEMEEEQAIPSSSKQSVLSFENKPSPAADKKSAHSSMNFKVQGDMKIELQFEVGGKTVMIDVSESGLTIQMDSGVTFSVPVSDAHSLKKAV